MEQDSGAPYYKAVVAESPKFEPYGLVTVRVRLHRKYLTAKFLSGNVEAPDLKPGDEVWVCPLDGDAGPVIRHNPLMRFFMRLLH